MIMPSTRLLDPVDFLGFVLEHVLFYCPDSIFIDFLGSILDMIKR